jgi:hypothetical protein
VLVLVCVPLMWQALLAFARWRNGELVALAQAPTRIPGVVEEEEEGEEGVAKPATTEGAAGAAANWK